MHLQWVNMLKVENCTYALVANLLYGRLSSLTFNEFISLVQHGWWSTIPPLSTCSMA